MEDVCVDCFYWFDKSTKRKGMLVDYYEIYDQDYQSVLKHISVRWLSLKKCSGRILKKYSGLKSYFLSEHFTDKRFRILNRCFNDFSLGPALFFSQAAISIFTNFNLLPQREPTVQFTY